MHSVTVDYRHCSRSDDKKKKKGDENEFKIHMFEEHTTRTLVTQNKLSEELDSESALNFLESTSGARA